jgi:fatty acid desaturase
MTTRTTLEGRGIIVTSWVTTALFAAIAVPDALGASALDRVAVGTAIALFFVSLPVWAAAFLVAVARSARGDDMVAGVTAAADPFGVMVPMLPLGLVGLWGARHGHFPRRTDSTRRRERGGRSH